MTKDTTTDWISVISRDRQALAFAETDAAKIRRLFYYDIISAYKQVQMQELVAASGLTRQRIHQILKETR